MVRFHISNMLIRRAVCLTDCTHTDSGVGKIFGKNDFKAQIREDKETLDALIDAHVRSVPFENIDIYDDEADISLNIGDLYEKIVVSGRGGYCFEPKCPVYGAAGNASALNAMP
jgi:hypothetical protein